jgi:hypothetical protein
MENAPELVVRDPVTGQDWKVPSRPLRSVIADARERWMINVAIDPVEAARLVEAPFLIPERINGKAVMALCVIAMDRAAPDWAPLDLGPAVLACALRVGCRHRETGEPAVWVATRHTDHVLGRVLPVLGFPDIQVGLRPLPGLQPGLAARGVLVAMRPGPAPASELFAVDTDFDAFIAAGVRSYGRGAKPGTWSAVDLLKDHASSFTRLTDRRARLILDGMPWEVDSIYRCPGGRWRWDVHGAVDAAGAGLVSPLPAAVATHPALQHA